MSEYGVIAYGWYAPIRNPNSSHQPGQRHAMPYTLLSFHAEVTSDLLEVSDESKVMVPWRGEEVGIHGLHPQHRQLFWEGGIAEVFRGKDLIVPRIHTFLAKGETFLFEEQKAAATWCDSVDEIHAILKKALAGLR
ncbi:MAG: hypothetical protein U0487_01410 [Patescibacteria group bacterium]